MICKRHLSTDQVIPYLNRINPPPNTIILNHFGVYMDSPLSKRNFIQSQVKKLKKLTNIDKIVAGKDDLKLQITELL